MYFISIYITILHLLTQLVMLENVCILQIALQLTNLHTGCKTSKSEITLLRCENALRMIS